jgi:DNA-binding beta-propeller fold protein YncE
MTNLKSSTKNARIFLIVSLITLSLILTAVPQTVQAEPEGDFSGRWVITVTNTGGYDENHTLLGGALYTVDAETDTLYGPFLAGQLGAAGGGLFDIAVTPDGNTAVVSNFGNRTVYFVDVSDPTNLQLLGHVNITIFAEDIAITPDGKFALVADGGFSSYISSINIATRTLIEEANLTDTGVFANAVTVAPDGTVICADYFQGMLQTFTVDGFGHLTTRFTYNISRFTTDNFNFTDRPVNVAVAPDGQTVLLMTTTSPYVTVYQITSPGTLTYIGRVPGLPAIWDDTENNEQWWGSRQSVAFSSDGRKAFVIDNGVYDPVQEFYLNNTISVLDITAPGSVSLSAPSAAILRYNSSSQLFGVDVLDIALNKLYVGNPTLSNGVPYLHVVNLNDFSVSTIPVGKNETEVVVGVATIPYIPHAVGGFMLQINIAQSPAPFVGLAAVLIIVVVLLCIVVKVTRVRRLNSSL